MSSFAYQKYTKASNISVILSDWYLLIVMRMLHLHSIY
jgi:hypothetical protein